MQLTIAKILVIITTAILVAVIIELNKLGVNLDKNISKPNILYISDALLSAVCGILLSLAAMLVTESFITWLIASIIGTFMGKQSFKIVMKIFLTTLKVFKETDFENILEDDDSNTTEGNIEAVGETDNDTEDTNNSE